MSIGGRLRRGSEPTRTTNLDGVFTLNECADYIAEDKWPTIPDKIEDLVVNSGNGVLDLSWSAPLTNGLPISLYIIEYETNNEISTITTNNTSYQINNLTNNTEYGVRVGAAVGNRVNYSAKVNQKPLPPQGISYSSGWSGLGTQESKASTGSFTNSSRYFTANVSGTLYWTFNHGSDGGNSTNMTLRQGGTVLVSSWEENGSVGKSAQVTADTAYEMTSGWGGNSVSSLYIVPDLQVTGLTVVSVNDGEINLSWSAPSNNTNITDYLIEYTPSNGDANEALVGSTTTSYQLTGLVNSIEYTIRVVPMYTNIRGDYYSLAVTGPPQPALDFSGSSGTRIYYSPVPATAATIEATLSSNRGNRTISGGIDTSFGDQSVNFDLSSRVQFGHNHTGRYFIAGHTNNHCSGTVAVTMRDASGNIVAQGTSPSQQFNGGDDD